MVDGNTKHPSCLVVSTCLVACAFLVGTFYLINLSPHSKVSSTSNGDVGVVYGDNGMVNIDTVNIDNSVRNVYISSSSQLTPLDVGYCNVNGTQFHFELMQTHLQETTAKNHTLIQMMAAVRHGIRLGIRRRMNGVCHTMLSCDFAYFCVFFGVFHECFWIVSLSFFGQSRTNECFYFTREY